MEAQAPVVPLTASEVRSIVSHAEGEARRLGLAATIAVTDQEGHALAVFVMRGARSDTRIPGPVGHGLEGRALPAFGAALSKAGTAAFLSTGGHAFTSRTASFIIQDHFPPGIDFTPGGPLFGVQFSSLPCSDFKGLPAGLAGDPGGIPLYRNGRVVGAVGVEADGVYGVDENPADFDIAPEELAALAGTRGFEAPRNLRADRIIVNGTRLPFANGEPGPESEGPLDGTFLVAPQPGQASAFLPITIGDFQGRSDPRFPVRAGSVLTADEVTQILDQAANQAVHTRAAIRQPLGSPAQITVVVVDLDGTPLGNLRTNDAPVFGFDVAVQKARTAAFFSSPGAGAALRRAGLAIYDTGELPLDGSVAYTTRAIGFLSQPFFPPGIPDTDAGPFSPPGPEWSPFNTGLQLDVVLDKVEEFLETLVPPAGCSAAIPQLRNGITIFPGGVPLYKNGRLAGAVGVSGDGVDQDDLISSAGSAGFEAPATMRCDQIVYRGVRLPYVKYPRHPDL